jgi:hypothetical protein
MSIASRDPKTTCLWQQARTAYRVDAAPDGLEATLLARFGEMRAQASTPPVPLPVAVAVVEPSTGNAWRRLFSLTRLHPALAGAFSLCVLLAFSVPWWLQWIAATPEATTPFMLVSEPNGGQLNVSQLVRVSVSREAMLDFGIPVPQQRLLEPVRAEMLLGQRGELLAVRFIEQPQRRRFSFD